MFGTIEILIWIGLLTLIVGLTIAYVRSNTATNKRIDRLIETVMQLRTEMYESNEKLRQGQEKPRTEMHEGKEKLRQGKETLHTEMREGQETLHTEMRGDLKEAQKDLRKINRRLSRLEGFVYSMWGGLFGEENVRYQLRETEKSSTMSVN